MPKSPICLVLLALVMAFPACGGSEPGSEPAATDAGPPVKPAVSDFKGRFVAEPNPIQVCDKSGLGMTTLFWEAPGVRKLEVRVGPPPGKLFATSGPKGSKATGNWVRDRTNFSLVDSSDGRILSVMEISLTREGCPGGPGS